MWSNPNVWALSVPQRFDDSSDLTRRTMFGQLQQSLVLQGKTNILCAANLLSGEKFSQRVKARNHTPKPQRSNVSSLLNDYSTSVTELH